MTDNVLGILFQNIADAIRSKTGDTATMKPAEFPTAIEGITVGTGGDTGSSGSNIKRVSDWLEADDITLVGDSCTVTHNLGIRPDLIMVMAGQGSLSANGLLFAYGLSSELKNAIGDTRGNLACLTGSASPINSMLMPFSVDATIDGTDGTCIMSATTTTFKLFSSLIKPISNMNYFYVVIGGLV